MLMDAFHKDPFWEELGGRCLSCTACSAVCPTCFCFDIQDTFDPSGEAGRRERVWDACTAPQFAQVATTSAATGATACGIACTTSSTGSSRTMTACCAWGAVAA